MRKQVVMPFEFTVCSEGYSILQQTLDYCVEAYNMAAKISSEFEV